MEILDSIEACTSFDDLSLDEKKYFILDTIDVKYDLYDGKSHIKGLKNKISCSNDSFNGKMFYQLIYIMSYMQKHSISKSMTTCLKYKNKPFFQINKEGKVERVIYYLRDSKASILYSTLNFFKDEFLEKENVLKLKK